MTFFAERRIHQPPNPHPRASAAAAAAHPPVREPAYFAVPPLAPSRPSQPRHQTRALQVRPDGDEARSPARGARGTRPDPGTGEPGPAKVFKQYYSGTFAARPVSRRRFSISSPFPPPPPRPRRPPCSPLFPKRRFPGTGPRFRTAPLSVGLRASTTVRVASAGPSAKAFWKAGKIRMPLRFDTRRIRARLRRARLPFRDRRIDRATYRRRLPKGVSIVPGKLTR